MATTAEHPENKKAPVAKKAPMKQQKADAAKEIIAKLCELGITEPKAQRKMISAAYKVVAGKVKED
jgi:hypothetical protein